MNDVKRKLARAWKALIAANRAGREQPNLIPNYRAAPEQVRITMDVNAEIRRAYWLIEGDA